MKKLLFSLPLILLGLSIVGCNPISTEPSNINPSNDSSDGGSSNPDHQHDISTTWSYDDTSHYHECSGCTEHFEVAAHTFDDGVVTKDATETEAGNKKYTCTVCGYIKNVAIPPLGEDIFVKMNEKLALHTEPFVDHYEVRDYLLNEGYDITSQLADGRKFGYSLEHNTLVEYKQGVVLRPVSFSYEYDTYSAKTVSTFMGLVSAFNGINNGTDVVSTIKLNADITQTGDTDLAQYTSGHPLELDLNNHSILAPTMVDKSYTGTKWYTLQFLDLSKSAHIYIHGNSSTIIEANRKMKVDGVEDDACCLSLVAASSFRIENLKLLARNGTQCIGDLSQYINNHNDKTKKVYIDNVNMEAPLRAITIAGGDWNIDNCSSIKGMVVIDGGKVVIDHSTIDASTSYISGLNDYEEGFTNSDLLVQNVATLNGQPYNKTVREALTHYMGAVTFNDAIVVTSRRMTNYSVSDVTVRNCSLSPVVVNSVPTGYGFRYWDLEGFTSSDAINPTLVNNTYPKSDSSGFGGSNYSPS